MRRALFLPLLALLAGTVGGAWGQGIYTCVDARGRRLTSDRPILECLDREQKELNSSGTVRRTLAPPLTAAERAVLDERERRAAEERQRQAEEKRMQRALVTRYPNQGVHDGERAKAVKSVEESMASAERRILDLREERKQLVAESEFYKGPELWPAKLKRQFEERYEQEGAQQRFIAGQEEEKRRINTRFDEEMVRLRVLWAQANGTAAAAATQAAPLPLRR